MKAFFLIYILLFALNTHCDDVLETGGTGGITNINEEESEFKPIVDPGTHSEGFLYEPYRPQIPENFDPKWYLENPHVPDILRKVLSEEDGEDHLIQYALKAHETCTQLRDSGLLDFFSKQVMSTVRTKPKVCDAIAATEEEREMNFYVSSSSSDQGYSYETQKRKVKYTVYKFDESKIDKDSLTQYGSLLLNTMNQDSQYNEMPIPKPISEQENLADIPQEQLNYMIDGIADTLKKSNPILIQTMLMRLWSGLKPLDQMKALRECPSHLGLNSSSFYWKVNDRAPEGSEANAKRFMEICKSQNMEELLPYLDESVMTEFALYASAQPNGLSHIVPLCLNWPDAQVVTPKPLPGVTREEVLYRASEISSGFNHSNTGTLGLINPREGSPLLEEQVTALDDYTGNGSYNRINAYEMWGRVGIWFLDEDGTNQSNDYFDQMYPTPRREAYETNEQYEEALKNHIEMRSQFLPDRYGTPEQRAQMTEARRSLQKDNPQLNDSMHTQSGTHLSKTVTDLRGALEGLDGFEGVTFGGHQLSGHLLKGINIREGATFKPSFFMSTSTNQGTALGFLGIQRGQGYGSYVGNNDQAEDKTGEVTGYLFVVRNRTAAPITNYSQYRGENEILLHPDTRYRILEVETLVHEGTTYPNAKVVYIEELP